MVAPRCPQLISQNHICFSQITLSSLKTILSSIMTQFYHCYHPASQHSTQNTPPLSSKTINDLPSVLKCIQRASLATNDVGLKLQLRQVVAFLQRQPQHQNKNEKEQRCGIECLESKIESCFPGCFQSTKKEERISTLYPISWERGDNSETIKSLFLDKISHSALSQEQPNYEHHRINLPTEVKSEYSQGSINDLTYRQKQYAYQPIKEKEELDSGQTSLINRLEWRSIVTKNDIGDQKLEEYASKEVIPQNEARDKTSEPVSIGDIARSENDVLKEQLRNTRMEAEALRSQLDTVKQQMKIKEEEVKKYELLLFVREQEVSSLRLVLKSMEVKTGSKSAGPVKTLRKAFQPLDENFSSPLS